MVISSTKTFSHVTIDEVVSSTLCQRLFMPTLPLRMASFFSGINKCASPKSPFYCFLFFGNSWYHSVHLGPLRSKHEDKMKLVRGLLRKISVREKALLLLIIESNRDTKPGPFLRDLDLLRWIELGPAFLFAGCHLLRIVL